MKRLFLLPILLVGTQAYATSTELDAAIMKVRGACGRISAEMSDMKRMAGINTAVTSVGTVAGGVALGTGIAKANLDKEIEKQELIKALESVGAKRIESETEFLELYTVLLEEAGDVDSLALAAELKKNIERSKRLGNWRTGMLATNTATNVAGAVIAGKNKIEDNLFERINTCISSVKELSRVKMQAHINGESDTNQDMKAQRIIEACSDWETVDLSSIDNRAKGATISSGVGAGVGLVGTIVSAVSNTEKTRNDNSEAGQKKEKNLNTTANIMAGGATMASGVATVFNATQISAIKRAADAADKCEEAL